MRRRKESGHDNAVQDSQNSFPSSSATIHKPVLLTETIGFLAPRDGGIYVDGTLGLGGHAECILEKCGPGGRLIAFEWDDNAIRLARERLQAYGPRLLIIKNNFAEIKNSLAAINVAKVDGLILDLGLSSLQLDGENGGGSGRGFSFQRSEPLDMRMDSSRQLTASELINKAKEDELADILYHYGHERHARRIAARIVQERKKEPVDTSDRLARIVAAAVPRRFHPKKIHVATKVFQATRIAVNSELANLARILDDAPSILKAEGRFCVISFHSLEDRMVKRKFKEDPALEVLTRKPITPTKEECLLNPRARSAKLRAAAVKSQEV